MASRPHFPQIEQDQATGELAAAYNDMRATLRVPWVMFAARALAVFGGFVPAGWRAAQPVFATRGVEGAADEIRASAVLPGEEPADPRPALARVGVDETTSLPQIRAALDALNYGNPKYLLLITAWCEAIQGRSSGGTPKADLGAGFDTAALPRGAPASMAELRLVDPTTVEPVVADLLSDITDTHFHHAPSSDFRVLANWPDALAVLHREVLAPVVRSESYDRTGRELLDLARRRVAAFPTAAGLDASQAKAVCTATELAAVTAMLSMFQRFILDVTIDMVRLTHALDGPERAASSPFPP